MLIGKTEITAKSFQFPLQSVFYLSFSHWSRRWPMFNNFTDCGKCSSKSVFHSWRYRGQLLFSYLCFSDVLDPDLRLFSPITTSAAANTRMQTPATAATGAITDWSPENIRKLYLLWGRYHSNLQSSGLVAKSSVFKTRQFRSLLE